MKLIQTEMKVKSHDAMQGRTLRSWCAWFVENDAPKTAVTVKEKPFTKRGLLSVLNSIFDLLF